jgi:uncharacterized protein with GYD domain
MRFYRCYFLNGVHKIEGVEAVECPDDVAVMRVAMDLLATKNLRHTTFAAVEIWEAARLVGVHPHDAIAKSLHECQLTAEMPDRRQGR